MTKAHKFKVKQLTSTPEAELGPTYSPKGDRIAFIRAGKLWTMKPDGTEQKVLINDTQVFDYDWSPDGKMIVFSRVDGSFASELFVVSVDGSAPPRNITRYATFNADVSWSRTGNKIGFIAQRRGMYTPHVIDLQKPGTPGAAGEIDWDDIHLRATRAAGLGRLGGDFSQRRPDRLRHSAGGDLWIASTGGRA